MNMEKNVCIRALGDINQINGCKSKIEVKGERISKLSKVLGLAGNEVRLKILYLMYEEKELCVCDLSDILGMNVSAISQHLRKLKDGNSRIKNKRNDMRSLRTVYCWQI